MINYLALWYTVWRPCTFSLQGYASRRRQAV